MSNSGSDGVARSRREIASWNTPRKAKEGTPTADEGLQQRHGGVQTSGVKEELDGESDWQHRRDTDRPGTNDCTVAAWPGDSASQVGWRGDSDSEGPETEGERAPT